MDKKIVKLIDGLEDGVADAQSPTKVLEIPKLCDKDISDIEDISGQLNWAGDFYKSRFGKFKCSKTLFGSHINTLVVDEKQLDIILEKIVSVKEAIESIKLKAFFEAVWNNYLLDIDVRNNQYVTLPSDSNHMVRSLMYRHYDVIMKYSFNKKRIMNLDIFNICNVIRSINMLSYCLRFEVVGEEKK